MSKLFEVFGYKVDDRTREAEDNRRAARCPFMGIDCDGGGNRYSSQINLDNLEHDDELKDYFRGRSIVHSGVCSVQPREGERPWIVCPRRLMVLGKSGMESSAHQGFAESLLLGHSGLGSETRLGVWAEVKIKYAEGSGEGRKSFDYTFDYVLMPLGEADQNEVRRATGERWEKLRPVMEAEGFSLARRGGVDYVEDFPKGPPLMIEIMTSSTSGGNKNRRTTIPMAFEDAVLGRPHNAPTINYRQVWARMVSQLVVKSEVGAAWGGKTIWILQDVLVDYISSSTALNVRQFLSNRTSEVNILSLSYGTAYKEPSGIVELGEGNLFAGPIRPPSAPDDPSFQDMIRTPIVPPKSNLIRALARRRKVNELVVL